MILAIDVHYRDDVAKSVSVSFNHWDDAEPSHINEVYIDEVEDYIPGSFYKRELPCILKVLELSDLSKVEVIVVDGYVFLDNDQKAGLGKYLYDALDSKIPIIGVAKKKFVQNTANVIEIMRGESQNTLYITSVGIDLSQAANLIENMHGEYRIPSILKILDQKTKEQ